MDRSDHPMRPSLQPFVQVTSREFEPKSRPEISHYVDVGAIDMGIVAVNVQCPVVRIRLQLNVAPVLEVNTGVHSYTTIEHPGLLAELITHNTIRFVRGGPLAARITLLLERPPPG